ncbi:MAG TPA: signal peptidase I [Candidatus Saccharimonadales bacterium]|nr:signal peptidase I [Candidatus Saccharimonadales bacterium]
MQDDQKSAPTYVAPAPNKESKDSVRSIISTISILLLAPVIAILLTVFVFQSYQVDGPSMETTLQNNDRLVVWKLARTWSKVTHHAYIPNRGDVIIFNEPEENLEGVGAGSKQLIKRVVGLPGDRIVVKDGVLTVYNNQHPNGFRPDKTLEYGKVIGNTSGDIDVTLNANQLFVCGDNRPDSLDSRVFGPISTDQVVGKLVMRILPLNNAKRF